MSSSNTFETNQAVVSRMKSIFDLELSSKIPKLTACLAFDTTLSIAECTKILSVAYQDIDPNFAVWDEVFNEKADKMELRGDSLSGVFQN